MNKAGDEPALSLIIALAIGGLFIMADFIELPLSGTTVFLTQQEIESLFQRADQELKERIQLNGMTRDELNLLLLKDVQLFKTAIKRGKAILRSRKQKDREAQKFNSQNLH
jgi:hypothetical protein